MARHAPQHLFDLEAGWQAGSKTSRLDPVPDWLDLEPRRRHFRSFGVSVPTRTPRAALWFGAIAAVLLLFVARAWQLQYLEGGHFRSVAEGNRVRIHDIKARRGVLYDRNNVQLVENIPSFSLAIIPVDVPRDDTQRQSLFDQVASLVQVDPAAVAGLVGGAPAFSYQPVIVAENITYERAIQATILQAKLHAVRVLSEQIRHYLPVQPGSSSSLSHLFGYVSRIHSDEVESYLSRGYSLDDFVGRSGLEQSYEQVLKGQNGKEQVEVEASGKPKETIARTEPVDGLSLQLSIDLELQQYAESRLAAELRASGTHRGSVVVLDPNTGEVLALVSLPGYDNNLFAHGISLAEFSALVADPNRPLFARAVSGEYPSGSTFKLVVGAAGIQEGVITPRSTVLSTGGIRVGQWFFPDWKAGGHGITDLRKAIAQSVNTFFYILGGGYGSAPGLGIDRLAEYAGRFGLGKPLGIDLPQEASGLIPTPDWKEQAKHEQWYIGDTYHVAIGQGDLLVTPLQVAAWTSVFANGGTLYQPHVVRAELDSTGKPVRQISTAVLRQPVVSPDAIAAVNAGLREAVVSGSARRLNGLPIHVSAKTGTAEWSNRALPHAWLTAFGPTESPQLVVTVLIEAGGEGSSVALPVAYDIFQWWAAHRLSAP